MYIYRYILSSTVYMLCLDFFFLFLQQYWSCKTKNNPKLVNLRYWIVSGTLERFISDKTDWIILLCWFFELSYMSPLEPNLDQQNINAHLGWRVRQPSRPQEQRGPCPPVFHTCFNETVCISCKLCPIKSKNYLKHQLLRVFVQCGLRGHPSLTWPVKMNGQIFVRMLVDH